MRKNGGSRIMKPKTTKAKAQAYEAEALKVIKEREIMFFDHMFAFTSFCSSTAYNHGLEKLQSIKDAILKNRTQGQGYMLQKWIASDNPTLQIAAMRLISSPEMHRLLNQSYVKSEVETKLSPELKKQLEEAQKKIKV